MKVIVAGSRNIKCKDLIFKELDAMRDKIDEVVCGEATGVDTIGKEWAIKNEIAVKSFPAEWDKYGRMAGPIRNMDMGDYADYLIAFWDGQSVGTKHMFTYMQQINKHGKVVLVKVWQE